VSYGEKIRISLKQMKFKKSLLKKKNNRILGGVPFYMHCLKGMKHIYIKDSGVVD